MNPEEVLRRLLMQRPIKKYSSRVQLARQCHFPLLTALLGGVGFRQTGRGAASLRIGVHGNTSGSFLPFYWIGVDKFPPRRSHRSTSGEKAKTRVY